MALVSMERSKKERAEEFKPDPDDEKYPWGLRLHLDEESMEKLGVSGLSAGQDVDLRAVATVKQVSSSDSDSRGSSQSAELMITDLEINPEKSREDQANSLYD